MDVDGGRTWGAEVKPLMNVKEWPGRCLRDDSDEKWLGLVYPRPSEKAPHSLSCYYESKDVSS